MQARNPPLAGTTGVGVVNQKSVKDRFTDIHNSMMKHSFAKTGSGDHPSFGIVDRELCTSPDDNRSRKQVGSKLHQTEFNVRRYSPYFRAMTFPFSRLVKGQPQVVTRHDSVEEITLTFHYSVRSCQFCPNLL